METQDLPLAELLKQTNKVTHEQNI